MNDRSRRAASDLIDLIDSMDNREITAFDITEYSRGDPTTGDYTPTGVEIELTCFISFNQGVDDDENPYRVK